MNKINISASDAQTATIEQINALAMNILNRKGDVDMSSCNVTITPPSDMDADMAGIIVKCASTQNGTVNISGHTDIIENTWNAITNHGVLPWMIDGLQAGVPYETIIASVNAETLSRTYVSSGFGDTEQTWPEDASVLFDGSLTNKAFTGYTDKGYAIWKYSKPVKANVLHIYGSPNNNSRNPSSIKLYGSLDGTTFYEIYYNSSPGISSTVASKEFPFDIPCIPAQYYKIAFTGYTELSDISLSYDE